MTKNIEKKTKITKETKITKITKIKKNTKITKLMKITKTMVPRMAEAFFGRKKYGRKTGFSVYGRIS